MIRLLKSSLQEAKEWTKEALLEDGGSSLEAEVTTIELKGVSRLLNIYLTQQEGNKAKAYIVDFPKEPILEIGEIASIIFLSGEEVEALTFTYPFKGMGEATAFFLMCCNLCTLVKPTKEVKAEEAFTTEVRSEIDRNIDRLCFDITYTGKDFFLENKDDLFRNETNKDTGETTLILNATPSPLDLEECTGVKVKAAKDYIKGMEQLFGRIFTQEEISTTTKTFTFCCEDLFLSFLVYEFLRTEDYKNLQENLNKHSLFLLPKDWEKKSSILKKSNYSTAEEYVLSYYLALPIFIEHGQTSLREISRYTGIPYATILRLSQSGDKAMLWNDVAYMYI